MLVISLLFLSIFVTVFSNNIPPCLPERISYRTYYPCLENDPFAERDDEMARLQGAPTRFAQTGFYDRLFRMGNTYGANGIYDKYPNLGYNGNLPGQQTVFG